MEEIRTRSTPSELQQLIPKTIFAIVNPVAGGGKPAHSWPRLRHHLEQLGLRIHEVHTTEPGAGSYLVRDLIEKGVHEILVVGGDGTVNEVVNGCLHPAGQLLSPVTLTLVPCGTGRDFPRFFGITRPEQVIDVLRSGEIIRVDVGYLEFRTPNGTVRSRFFVNMADIGLGAETAAWVSHSTKQLGGFLAYFIGALRTIMRYRAVPLTIAIDHQVIFSHPALMVAIANGRFHAGGMRIAPMASAIDGQFEVFALRAVSRWQLFTSLLPTVYRGTHIAHPAVQHWSGQVVQVTAARPVPIEMDGEPVGTTDITARIVPRALPLRVPRGSLSAHS